MCEDELLIYTFKQSCYFNKMVKCHKLEEGSNSQHVAIVGAGIKGLYAAQQLCRLGNHVTVLERAKRPGGKIKTVYSNEMLIKEKSDVYNINPHPYVEMGAMRILECHHNTLDLIKELKLEVNPFIEDNNNAPFVINSQRHTVGGLNVGVLIDAGLVPFDILQCETILTRETTFNEVLLKAFKDNKDTILQAYGQRITDRSNQISVSEYLELPGKDYYIRMCAAAILALRNGEDGNHHVEAIDEFVNILKLHSGNPLAIKGGFGQIIPRLIKQLTNCSIMYECEVIKIKDKGLNGTTLFYKTSTNEVKRIQSDGVLLSCPSIHNISILPTLPNEHLKIIRKLKNSCIPAVKFAMLFKERFWEEEKHGRAFGGTCWIAPSGINQIYLPSPLSSSKEGYLMGYLRGNPVKRWLNTPEKERIAMMLDDVEKLFPSAKNIIRNLYQGFTEQVWQEEGAGAYVLMNAESIRNSLTPVGRIVFSPVPRGWINDTLNDAQIAVDEIQKVLNYDIRKKSIFADTCNKNIKDYNEELSHLNCGA